MADRFPLILNTSANQIQEIASGDGLDLTGSNVKGVGILTAGNVTIGAATTDLIVNGDARVTGILTIGTSSLKLDGPNNLVNVGTALTLGHTQGLQFHNQNLHSAGFEVNQINASGIITATGADINGDLDVDGHTNLDNVSIAGVSTFAGNINVTGNSTISGDLTLSDQQPRLYFIDNAGSPNNPDYLFQVDGGTFLLHDSTNVADRFSIAANGHIRSHSNHDFSAGIDVTGNATVSGNLSVGGVLTYEDVTNVDSVGIITARAGINLTGGDITLGDSAGPHKLKFGAGADFQLFHNGSNNYIDVAGNGHLYIRPKANFYIQDYTNGEVWIDGTLNGGVKLYNNGIKKFETDGNGITVQGNINMATDSTLQLGVGNDFKLFHNGTTNFIRSTNGNIHIDDSSGVVNAKFIPGGASELYHNGTKRLETTGSGVEIPQALFVGEKIDMPDHTSGTNGMILLGTGDDLYMYHDGTNSHLRNNTGTFNIRSTNFRLTDAALQHVYLKTNDSGNNDIQLYYDNNKKFETTSNGGTLTGQLTVTSHLLMGDGDKIKLGDSNDLELHHSSGENYIQGHTNQLYIRSAQGIYIQPNTNENGVVALANGAAELYYDNSKKLETTTTGIDVTGRIDLDDNTVQLSNNTANKLKITTPHGYVAIGPGNSSYCHFETDRSNYYFNTSVSWNGDVKPYTTGKNLGTSSYRWSSLYVSSIYANAVAYYGVSANSDAVVIQNSGGFKMCVGSGTGTGTVSMDARSYDTDKARLHKWTSPNLGGGSYGNYSEAWYDGGTYRYITSKSGGFEFDHHIIPETNNSKDLGTSSKRWRNIYANDLNLSNEGGANDVDNTWGDYTIQEGESDLYLINNRSGKKYKFNLTEVS